MSETKTRDTEPAKEEQTESNKPPKEAATNCFRMKPEAQAEEQISEKPEAEADLKPKSP